MAAFGSLQALFEKPLPENPTLMESLSWNRIKAVKPPDDAASFTEIFGELHFEERRPPAADAYPSHSLFNPADAPPASSWSHAWDRRPALDGKKENLLRRNREDPSMDSSPAGPRSSGEGFPSSLDSLLGVPSNQYMGGPRGNGAYFAKGHAGSLQLCTEGLGFESSDDVEVEVSRTESGRECCWRRKETAAVARQSASEGCNGCARTCSERRPRAAVEFPPPISCIGSRGKPWVEFRSYREGGRFVLREVRLPNQELLHASRKDGRLKLQFVQPEEEDYDDADKVGDGGDGEEAEGGEEGGEEAEEEGEEGKKEDLVG